MTDPTLPPAPAGECSIDTVTLGAGRLAVIAGPCMAESLDVCLAVAERLAALRDVLDIGFVFKASYDKANRSSLSGVRGPGLDEGLAWLAEVRERFGLPVLTDVHETHQVAPAAEAVDCLQIPAFLCRQTDLLLAAGRAGKAVNIKKGQFLAPWDMANAVEKVRSTGNDNVAITDRGVSFGYNRLISDFRGIAQMRATAPVVFDATHSTQEPGGLGNASGGQREFVPVLAGAAMAAGADALFLEVHPDPDKALSDAGSQWPLDQLEPLLRRCLVLFQAARETLD